MGPVGPRGSKPVQPEGQPGVRRHVGGREHGAVGSRGQFALQGGGGETPLFRLMLGFASLALRVAAPFVRALAVGQ